MFRVHNVQHPWEVLDLYRYLYTGMNHYQSVKPWFAVAG